MAVKLIVEKFLPFPFSSSGTGRAEPVRVLTAATTVFPELSARHVKHLIMKIYVATDTVSRTHFLCLECRRPDELRNSVLVSLSSIVNREVQ